MLDLEDAVSPLKKTKARAMVCEAARKGYGPRKQIAIRINALDSIWGNDDLAHAVDSGAHAVVVPKVASAEALIEVATKMDDLGAPKDMASWAMIETPLGVLNVHSIARSGHPRLACLVAGTFDLANELHCTATPCRHALVPSLAQIVLAARAYNLTCLDGVHLDLDNATDFALQLKQGKEMGFHGKTLLHPEVFPSWLSS
ncbi:hypothetical protein AC1031_021124 [Aphanomyces cochlioides]|nr:hypothetical protein AC1031_021124 [Aphanomyces cochlioides]